MKKVSLIICLFLATALPVVGMVHRAHASIPERFGSAVAISSDGSSILIGALGAPVTTSAGTTVNAGEAFLFDSSGNLLQTYQDPNPTDREFFGSSVAISSDGSTILIGATDVLVTTSGGTTVNAGEAFLFDSSGNLLQTYQDPNPSAGEDFGLSVGISGDGSSVLIGAQLAFVTTSAGMAVDAGEAFLFDSSGNLLQTYQDPNPTSHEFFGSSVALSGDGSTILIGANMAPVITSAGTTVPAGEAFLFDSSGNLLQTYQDPNPTDFEVFGSSVAISGDGSTILIGAPNAFVPLPHAGEAFLFDSSGNLLQTYQDLNPHFREFFGSSVAISGDGSTILIGTHPEVVDGEAFLFDLDGNLLQAYQDPSPTNGGGFGASVVISSDGSTILIGAFNAPVTTSAGTTVNAGEAFLFDSSRNLLQTYQDPNL